jgi:hypothetical protein
MSMGLHTRHFPTGISTWSEAVRTWERAKAIRARPGCRYLGTENQKHTVLRREGDRIEAIYHATPLVTWTPEGITLRPWDSRNSVCFTDTLTPWGTLVVYCGTYNWWTWRPDGNNSGAWRPWAGDTLTLPWSTTGWGREDQYDPCPRVAVDRKAANAFTRTTWPWWADVQAWRKAMTALDTMPAGEAYPQGTAPRGEALLDAMAEGPATWMAQLKVWGPTLFTWLDDARRRALPATCYRRVMAREIQQHPLVYERAQRLVASGCDRDDIPTL